MLPALLNAAGLALSLGPMIAGFFKGDNGNAEKIAAAREGLAARLAEAHRIPLTKAMQIVDDQLKPLADDHGGSDSGWSALSAALGTGLLLKGAGAGKAAGKLAGALGIGKKAEMAAEAGLGAEKGIAAEVAGGHEAADAASAVKPAAAAAADDGIPDGVYTARQAGNDEMMARARTGEFDRVSPGRRRGQRPRLGYEEPLEAELMEPEEPPNRPPNAAGSRESFIPSDGFTMRDPLAAPRRLEYDAPEDNTPPNAAGMRETIVPTDRFVMRDPRDFLLGHSPQGGGGMSSDLADAGPVDRIPSIEEIMRHRAAMRRLGA